MKVVLYLRCFLFGAKSSTSVSLSGLVGAALGWLLSSSALTSSVEIPIWVDWGVVVVGGGCWWACWLTCCRLTWFTWLELLVLLAGLVCGTACSPPPPPPPRIEWSAIQKVYVICGIDAKLSSMKIIRGRITRYRVQWSSYQHLDYNWISCWFNFR